MTTSTNEAGKAPSADRGAERALAGVGLGLRWDFIEEILEVRPPLAFVEVSPENYMGRGGYYDEALERAKETWPIVTHGLTMNLGGHDALRADYLFELRDFVERAKSPWHSDHLCFGSVGGVMLHELLPLSFKKSEVQRIADRIKRAEDVLRRPMAIENVSYYLHPGKQEMPEAEFLARVCEAADCRLMLDVNNAWVNATNFGHDVDDWMRTIPLDRVVQMHVAGHDWYSEPSSAGGEFVLRDRPADPSKREGAMIVDSHGNDVAAEVLALLERTLERTGPVPVLLERDQSIPPLPDLLEEVRRIDEVWRRAVAKHASRRAHATERTWR